MTHLYAGKGKKVIHVDLKKDKPDAATLAKLLLGPSGFLRAPAWRKGKIFFVGFNDDAYADILL
jgi:hypothetical protein